MVRETLWLQGVVTEDVLAAASSAVVIGSLNAAALALRPFTIVRTRGVLQVRSDQIAASEQYEAQYGHAVVSDQAVGVGVTALPTPDTDNGSDLWMVFQTVMGTVRFVTGAGFSERMSQLEFDSKAMRKVEGGQDLVLMAEASAISSGLTLRAFSRILIKLH